MAATIDAFINRIGDVTTPFALELPDGRRRDIGAGAAEVRGGAAQRPGHQGAEDARRGQHRRGLSAGRPRHRGRHDRAVRAARFARRPASAGYRLALRPAARDGAGLHQQAGDRLALQSRPKAVPELSRSGAAGLQPGHLRARRRDARNRAAPKVRLLRRALRAEARQPRARDRAGLGRLREPRHPARRKLHRRHQRRGLAELPQSQASEIRRQFRDPAHGFPGVRAEGKIRRHRHHGRHRASAALRARAAEILRASEAGRAAFSWMAARRARNTSCRPSWSATSIRATTRSWCSTIS